jgi:hypothetical protein
MECTDGIAGIFRKLIEAKPRRREKSDYIV